MLDLNVVVSGLIQPRGPSGRVLRAVFDRRVEVVACPRWFGELGEVLARPKFARRWTRLQAEEVRLALAGVAVVVPDPEQDASTARRSRDPDDDYLLVLAEQQSCDAVVSGDEDLLVLPGEPPVLTPRAFMEALDRTR